MDKAYDVLMPHIRQNPNWESVKAESMFKRFLDEGFCYDDISNHPDYGAYASAEMLLDMIPWMIDEMLKRNDFENYLIHPIIMSLDLQAYELPIAQERVKKLISIADKPFAQRACQFLGALADDPPIPQEDFDRVYNFWRNKLNGFS